MEGFLSVLAQTSSRYLPLYAFLYGLISIDYYLVLFSVFGFFNGFINFVLKTGFRYLYQSLNKTTIPLIGRGMRPLNNKYCGDIPTPKNMIKRSLSFGMPSGHSQGVWFFVIFMWLYLVENVYSKENITSNIRTDKTPFFNKNEKKSKLSKVWVYLTTILLFSIGLYVSYSRVKVDCHTVQQVIIGGLIGAPLGFIFYVISSVMINGDFENIFNKIKAVYFE